MADVFRKAKRSEVMSRIRSRGNRNTEGVLAGLFRREGFRGWRRQRVVRRSRILPCKKATLGSLVLGVRHFSVRPDFVFPRQKVAVFVDGCFWHGCPRHAKPSRWIRKSSMEEPRNTSGHRAHPSPERVRGAQTRARMGKGRFGASGASHKERTGKAFWRAKMAANVARDRKVNRTLRREGWKVVRVWEHELASKRKAVSREQGIGAVLRRIRKALRRPGLAGQTRDGS